MPPMGPGGGPVPGLPPRIEREGPATALPPRIERGAEAALPPRIEREPEPAPAPAPEDPPRVEPEPSAEPELPPRIERAPEPADAPPPVTPEAPPEQAEPPPAPAVPATESPPPYRPKHAREQDPAGAPELTPEHVPGPKAEPQPAPIAPVRPDPLASPVRNVLRSHQRLAYILAAVILIAAAGWWMLRVHQRIGEHALEAGITKQQHAPTVQCASLQTNGAAWACAVVYKAESVCLIARVNLLGSWSTAVGQHRCERVPRLERLAPQGVTASMVAADIDRRQGRSDFVCGKLPSHKVRWACQRPVEEGGQCLVVRVIQWTSWNVLDGDKTCAHDPELRKALRRASAGA
jgi:hypothetical protein